MEPEIKSEIFDNIGNDDYSEIELLPVLVFEKICSYLNASFVINVLRDVCETFKNHIDDLGNSFWKNRIKERWPKQYPLISVDINWEEACILREENYDAWKNVQENMKYFHLKDAHFGCVNVVSLFEDGQFCASGGRDGNIKVWDMASFTGQQEGQDGQSHLILTRTGAHTNAWVWCIAYNKSLQHLYSGGFDSCIKVWDNNIDSTHLMIYKLPSPVLSLAYNNNIIAAGCYGRSVSYFDSRADDRPIYSHIKHKKPVVCLSLDDKYIISGSEDKSVIVYDIAARKVWKKLEFDDFPLSMSYEGQQLLVGDVKGRFHAFNPTNESLDKKSYESGHNQKVTGIQQSLGSIITCSTDKTIRVLEPNAEPLAIAVLQSLSEVSRISAYKTTLVSANTDDSIAIWKPREDI